MGALWSVIYCVAACSVIKNKQHRTRTYLRDRHTGGVRTDEQNRINGAQCRQRFSDKATDTRATNAKADEIGGEACREGREVADQQKEKERHRNARANIFFEETE